MSRASCHLSCDVRGASYQKESEINSNRYLRTFAPEELQRRPVTWTIGGLTPTERFFDNVVTAHAAGLQLGLLQCKHFPQVSIPEVLANHIGNVAPASCPR